MLADVEPKCGGKRLKAHINSGTVARPLITIITPLFNGCKSLEASILSVLRQNLDCIEYLFVDGGSTDGSVDMLRKYEESIDYWVSEPDHGIYDAMNKGVQLATGRWLCFLGSDDTLCDTLATAANYLHDDRTIYYGNVFKTGKQQIYDGAFGAWKLSRRNICQQAIFYPRSLFEFHEFDLHYQLLADWELNLRCYSDPRFKFQFIPLTIANYNDTTGKSSVACIDPQFRRDHGRILRECLPAPCYLWYQLIEIVRPALAPFRRRK